MHRSNLIHILLAAVVYYGGCSEEYGSSSSAIGVTCSDGFPSATQLIQFFRATPTCKQDFTEACADSLRAQFNEPYGCKTPLLDNLQGNFDWGCFECKHRGSTTKLPVLGKTFSSPDLYQQSSCNAANSLKPNSGKGGEVVYALTPDQSYNEPIQIGALTSDPAFNLSLTVSTDCSNLVSSCLGGADSNGPGGGEVVTIPGMTEGKTYYVTVDGNNFSEGQFVLDIRVVSTQQTPIFRDVENTYWDQECSDESDEQDKNDSPSYAHIISSTEKISPAVASLRTLLASIPHELNYAVVLPPGGQKSDHWFLDGFLPKSATAIQFFVEKCELGNGSIDFSSPVENQQLAGSISSRWVTLKLGKYRLVDVISNAGTTLAGCKITQYQPIVPAGAEPDVEVLTDNAIRVVNPVPVFVQDDPRDPHKGSGLSPLERIISTTKGKLPQTAIVYHDLDKIVIDKNLGNVLSPEVTAVTARQSRFGKYKQSDPWRGAITEFGLDGSQVEVIHVDTIQDPNFGKDGPSPAHIAWPKNYYTGRTRSYFDSQRGRVCGGTECVWEPFNKGSTVNDKQIAFHGTWTYGILAGKNGHGLIPQANFNLLGFNLDVTAGFGFEVISTVSDLMVRLDREFVQPCIHQQKRFHVSTNSFGIGIEHRGLRQIYDQMRYQCGITNVAAAGNEGLDEPLFPASASSVIAASSVSTANFGLPNFRSKNVNELINSRPSICSQLGLNCGPNDRSIFGSFASLIAHKNNPYTGCSDPNNPARKTSYPCRANYGDVSAAGVVKTWTYTDVASGAPTAKLEVLNGTSFATPQVASLAALMHEDILRDASRSSGNKKYDKTGFSTMSPPDLADRIETAIFRTAKRGGYSRHGNIDATAAIDYMRAFNQSSVAGLEKLHVTSQEDLSDGRVFTDFRNRVNGVIATTQGRIDKTFQFGKCSNAFSNLKGALKTFLDFTSLSNAITLLLQALRPQVIRLVPPRFVHKVSHVTWTRDWAASSNPNELIADVRYETTAKVTLRFHLKSRLACLLPFISPYKIKFDIDWKAATPTHLHMIAKRIPGGNYTIRVEEDLPVHKLKLSFYHINFTPIAKFLLKLVHVDIRKIENLLRDTFEAEIVRQFRDAFQKGLDGIDFQQGKPDQYFTQYKLTPTAGSRPLMHQPLHGNSVAKHEKFGGKLYAWSRTHLAAVPIDPPHSESFINSDYKVNGGFPHGPGDAALHAVGAIVEDSAGIVPVQIYNHQANMLAHEGVFTSDPIL